MNRSWVRGADRATSLKTSKFIAPRKCRVFHNNSRRKQFTVAAFQRRRMHVSAIARAVTHLFIIYTCTETHQAFYGALHKFKGCARACAT